MLDKQAIIEILSERFSKDTHTRLSLLPKPSELKDAYKAAKRIKKAMQNGEKIAIVGDYDVDGVTSTTIMAEFFNDNGIDVIVKIPNRFKDGYGLNKDLISKLIGVNLIITVDNGISANEAALECEKQGIDLIITDHHVPPAVLPKAYAIVNPKQEDCFFPNTDICGAQVAWYVIAALKDELNLKDYKLDKFLDILALAIIADMMELKDMNRTLVKAGLKKINSSSRSCFKVIKNYYGKKNFNFDDISFLLTPLINSAGRMDDATNSYKFLYEKDLSKANKLFYIILDYNNSRKNQEKILFNKSLKVADENDNIIVTWGEDWHEGVIGIVASRLAKRYKKPAIVFSIGGCVAKGSARSVGKFDILSLIASQKNILSSFGGHKGAAGLVIETQNLALFKEKINESSKFNDYQILQSDEILGEIDPSAIDLDLINEIDKFEPFGQKNPRPIFEFKNITILNTKTIGNGDSHLKLTLKKDDKIFDGIFFNFDHRPKNGETVDMLISVQKNEFRGNVSVQLFVKEIYT